MTKSWRSNKITWLTNIITRCYDIGAVCLPCIMSLSCDCPDMYSRLCHNPYPIKCILLKNSHRFERQKDSHVHKPSFVHGWFHFHIISPWNRLPWTPLNGLEWVWVMTELTVIGSIPCGHAGICGELTVYL